MVSNHLSPLRHYLLEKNFCWWRISDPEVSGEPMTHGHLFVGGGYRSRTDDPLRARQVL